jgi:hypothetical protein
MSVDKGLLQLETRAVELNHNVTIKVDIKY